MIWRLVLTLALATSQQPLLAAPLSGIELANFDRSTRFQDDIDRAVNGHWLDRTTIPTDQSSYGAFSQLREQNDARLESLIKQLFTRSALDAEQQKIRDLYTSYLRVDAIEALGSRPVMVELQQLASLPDRASLVRQLGALQRSPLALPVILLAQPDARSAATMQLQISQGGLGMPDRDYYLDANPRFVAARQAYLHYLETLFALTKRSAPRQRAQSVLALETQLARIQWSAVDNRDPQMSAHIATLSGLTQQAPGIDWRLMFAAASLDPAPTRQFNLQQPGYLPQLATLLNSLPLESWRDYLQARLLDAYAPLLGRAFVDAHFAFHQQALSGVATPLPREKRAIALVERGLGQALGKLYVSRHFPAQHKVRVEQMAANVVHALRASIDTLDWMTPATRREAQRKLAKFRVKIGYPAQWKDYSALTIQPRDLVGNMRRLAAFNFDSMMQTLDQPVDREQWHMSPQTVNAYNDLQLHEIVLPAGILQPPLFDPQADDAVNYGAIGVIIGHEISHGFDDQGSHYDGDGKLRDWWSAEDRQRLKALTDQLVAQYSAYEPLPGHRVNGRLTLGENIADNAGLQLAYQAYRHSLAGATPAVIDGLSADQRFFIGFVQGARGKIRDAQMLKHLVNNPHTPPPWRVHGALVNSDAFHQAFNLKPSDRLYKPPDQRIRLW